MLRLLEAGPGVGDSVNAHSLVPVHGNLGLCKLLPSHVPPTGTGPSLDTTQWGRGF